MPVLRLVNTAIDGVASDPQAVLEDILRFASSDLLCYRADAPQGLVERQNEALGSGPRLGARRRSARASISPKASSMSSSRARRIAVLGAHLPSAPSRCGWPRSIS